MLYTAEDTPQVKVTVDDMPAVCASLDCGYQYVSADSSIENFAFDGNRATMTVTNPPASFESFKIGTVDCEIDVNDGTNIECSLGSNLPVTGPVTLNALTSSGLLPVTYVDQSQTTPMDLQSLSPSTVRPTGGSVIELQGQNFPLSLDSGDEVSVVISDGEGTCEIVSISSTAITCTIPTFQTVIDSGVSALASETRQIELTINGVSASLDLTLDLTSG